MSNICCSPQEESVITPNTASFSDECLGDFCADAASLFLICENHLYQSAAAVSALLRFFLLRGNKKSITVFFNNV